jgi:hypothetical protein
MMDLMMDLMMTNQLHMVVDVDDTDDDVMTVLVDDRDCRQHAPSHHHDAQHTTPVASQTP